MWGLSRRIDVSRLQSSLGRPVDHRALIYTAPNTAGCCVSGAIRHHHKLHKLRQTFPRRFDLPTRNPETICATWRVYIRKSGGGRRTKWVPVVENTPGEVSFVRPRQPLRYSMNRTVCMFYLYFVVHLLLFNRACFLALGLISLSLLVSRQVSACRLIRTLCMLNLCLQVPAVVTSGRVLGT